MKQYDHVLFALGHSPALLVGHVHTSYFAQFDIGNNPGGLTVANIFSEFSVDAEVQRLSWQPGLEQIFATTNNKVITFSKYVM